MKYIQLTRFQFILRSLLGSAVKRIIPVKISQPFPATIGEYHFAKIFTKHSPKSPYQFALYKSPSGKKVLAKRWTGIVKDFEYLTLANEAHVGQILATAQKRILHRPLKFKNLKVPTIAQTVSTRFSLTVLFAYKRGKYLTQTTQVNKTTIYLRCVEYLRFLDNHLTPLEKKQIALRTGNDSSFTYPLLLLKAIFTNPQATGPLLRAAGVWLKSPAPTSHLTYVLTHRDLHFKNILVDKNHIYIFDFQLAVRAHPLVEYITTALSLWHEEKVRAQLLTTIFNEGKLHQVPDAEASRLFIEIATHALIDKKVSRQKRLNYIAALSYGAEFTLPKPVFV